jgi:hypothetical protein
MTDNISTRPEYVILISMLVFIVLTMIEDIIHFNLGKYAGTKITYKKLFEVPNFKDFVEIGIIIIVFAFLQGVITNWLIILYSIETNQKN